jgi:hypothetical protein
MRAITILFREVQQQVLKPRIVADDEQSFDLVAGLSNDFEQYLRRCIIDPPIPHRGEGVARTFHDPGNSFGHANRGTRDDRVNGHISCPQLTANGHSRLAPALVERAVEIGAGRGIPARFGMTQDEQCLHRTSSG